MFVVLCKLYAHDMFYLSDEWCHLLWREENRSEAID